MASELLVLLAYAHDSLPLNVTIHVCHGRSGATLIWIMPLYETVAALLWQIVTDDKRDGTPKSVGGNVEFATFEAVKDPMKTGGK
jgi:hypothetical protein